MSKQLNPQSPYSRQKRIKHLRETLDKIGFSNMYNGASKSTTIDFDASFNKAKQCEVNGPRTQEHVGEAAFDKLASAKAEFREACKSCEFRYSEDCKAKSQKEAIFWTLVENAKVRQRFRDRTADKNVQHGLKTIPCKRLLTGGRIKLAEWTE